MQNTASLNRRIIAGESRTFMPALGVPTEIPRSDPLTRFQFYLGLADALFCRAQSTDTHLQELARAFGYDVLNLAVLAGRLLWCEGVTPQVWRSHDLIAVGVDTEAYYVMLQCACDIMADVVATLGAKSRQAPWESSHKLNQWALRNPNRLASEFRVVAVGLPWFDKINLERTAIVHRGEKPHTATDRVSFNSGSLLSSLRELTEDMLDFSEQLGRIVFPEAERERVSERRVIDGVYIPALHHLLNKYQVPKESPELKLAAQCLLGCGGYVEAAYIGYPDGFWWKLLFTISRALNVAPIAVNIPVNIYGEVADCTFVFSSNGGSCGFISYDRAGIWRNWVESVTHFARQLLFVRHRRHLSNALRSGQSSILRHLSATSVGSLETMTGILSPSESSDATPSIAWKRYTELNESYVKAGKFTPPKSSPSSNTSSPWCI